MRSTILKTAFVLTFALVALRPLYAIGFRGSKVPNTPLYDSRLFHFGFSLGMNLMNFSLKPDDNLGFEGDTLLGMRHGFLPGFSVGVVTDLRMGKYFNLRFIPTFSMGQRSIIYKTHLPDQDIRNVNKHIESIMVLLPLEVKWKAARMVNNRPYVTAGFQYTLDMASRKNKKKNAEDDERNAYKMKLGRHDVGVTVGAGWDFFLPYNNKLALEIKLYFGLLDLLVPEHNIYTDRINSLTSRMLQINFTFE